MSVHKSNYITTGLQQRVGSCRRRIKETAKREVRGGACDRAEVPSAPISALCQTTGLPLSPLHSPRVFVRFEWPAEPPAEWHVGQFRNRWKVGTPPAGILGHMLCLRSSLCTKQSTQRLQHYSPKILVKIICMFIICMVCTSVGFFNLRLCLYYVSVTAQYTPDVLDDYYGNDGRLLSCFESHVCSTDLACMSILVQCCSAADGLGTLRKTHQMHHLGGCMHLPFVIDK